MGFSFKRYKENITRTLCTLGIALLVAVALGMAFEWWRLGAARESGQSIEPGQSILDSISSPLPLASAAVRMAFPVMLALVAIPLLASQLVHKLHATKDINEAHEILNRTVFGTLGFRPYLLIKNGKIASKEDSPFVRIGGPCWTIIYSDTAVVTEQYGELKRVLGAGFWQLGRFERVWEVIDLRPQHWVYEVFALTKDGVPISCEADILFRIDDRFLNEYGKEVSKKSTSKEPYPYMEEAVFRAATNKWIREPDREDARMTWAGRVIISFTEGLLRNILAEYRLDWLIAPSQPGQPYPREEIRQRLQEGLEGSIRRVGARLIEVKIGEIQVKARDKETDKKLADIVSKQWIEAWHADWEARTLVSKAEGEAELLRMDMAQVQARAEMVVTLMEALQSTIVSQEAVEPYIVALRLVETLRWMSYDTYARKFMPPEALRTLNELQRLLRAEGEIPGEQGMGRLQEGAG